MIKISVLILGCITTLIILLVNQLIFILIAAYSGIAGNEHQLWLQYQGIIWQVMGLATLCGSMWLGGLTVRLMVTHYRALHGFIVACVISGTFIGSLSDRGQLTAMSMVVFLLAAVCGALGAHGLPWRKLKRDFN